MREGLGRRGESLRSTRAGALNCYAIGGPAFLGDALRAAGVAKINHRGKRA